MYVKFPLSALVTLKIGGTLLLRKLKKEICQQVFYIYHRSTKHIWTTLTKSKSLRNTYEVLRTRMKEYIHELKTKIYVCVETF